MTIFCTRRGTSVSQHGRFQIRFSAVPVLSILDAYHRYVERSIKYGVLFLDDNKIFTAFFLFSYILARQKNYPVSVS